MQAAGVGEGCCRAVGRPKREAGVGTAGSARALMWPHAVQMRVVSETWGGVSDLSSFNEGQSRNQH